MNEVSVYVAKTQLSRLLDRAEKGQEIVITRSGRPVAKLVPLRGSSEPRKLGGLKGRLRIPRDFDAPLPESVLKDFEGG